MSHLLLPTKIEGGQTKTKTADEITQQLLEQVLAALNKINTQLAMMTDVAVDEDESF